MTGTTFDEEDEERITVRRSHIWEDTLRALRRNLDLRKAIKVTFLGEPAIDDGGPCREYLRLLMKAVSQHSLLTGPPLRKVMVHNTLALQKQYYRYLGEAIVLSVTQGGPGPLCFAQSIVDYLQGGIERVTPRIEDIPNDNIQELLRRVPSIHACATLLYMILFACFVLHIYTYIYIYIYAILYFHFVHIYKFQMDIYRIMHMLCIYTYNPIIQILQINVTVEYFRSIYIDMFFLSIG